MVSSTLAFFRSLGLSHVINDNIETIGLPEGIQVDYYHKEDRLRFTKMIENQDVWIKIGHSSDRFPVVFNDDFSFSVFDENNDVYQIEIEESDLQYCLDNNIIIQVLGNDPNSKIAIVKLNPFVDLSVPEEFTDYLC